MNDQDLIRRGDAKKAIKLGETIMTLHQRIDLIPAVQVAVKPLTKGELTQFAADNPRDHLMLAAFSAWINVHPDQIPVENRFHTCPATKEAWGRVGEAIRSALIEHPVASTDQDTTLAPESCMSPDVQALVDAASDLLREFGNLPPDPVRVAVFLAAKDALTRVKGDDP